jgi:hypothetical protein
MAEDYEYAFSDISKPTRTQESWFVNATERVLGAAAQGVGSAVNRALSNATDISAAATAANAANMPKVVEGQWLRKISLIVYDAVANPWIGNIPPGEKGGSGGGNYGGGGDKDRTGIDLSEMRINFRVKKAVTGAPNYLEAKVYNLSPETIKKVRQYKRVQLAAGYQSNYGMIFDGTVLLYIVGKENPVDSYIDIRAGDADELNTTAIGMTWPPGTTLSTKAKDMITAGGLKVDEVKLGKVGDQKSLRSSSYIGMLMEGVRDITNATQSHFYVEDGKANVISWGGYKKNEVVELSTSTGLVNIPKVTPNGIEAECLLNPKLRLASLVKIETTRADGTNVISDIPYEPGAKNAFSNKEGNLSSAEGVQAGGQFRYPAAAINETEGRGAGVYKILLLDHRGDTRGNTWYSYMVCAASGTDGTVIQTSYAGNAMLRSMANVDMSK